MPVMLIIVGVTGDLSKRKLLPAIAALKRAGVVPDALRIIGVTRKSRVTLEELGIQKAHEDTLLSSLSFFSMDLEAKEEYLRLAQYLEETEKALGERAQRLFYLSVPPNASAQIIEALGTSGLSRIAGTKLLIEKPFGTDLSSAEALVTHINRHFESERVYRIDHYLAKEMAQNLIVFKEQNPLFRQTWNHDFIERIDIQASEKIGIEGRAHFYEQTGALRDIVQSHLLQLAALVLMHPNGIDNLQAVPERRLKALKALKVQDLAAVRRGQYRGYREEVDNPQSTVETYVSLPLTSTDPLFSSVPITLMTGKNLREKTTEIRVTYKGVAGAPGNVLTLRLQPGEGASLTLIAKRPGYVRDIEERTLGFTYAKEHEVLADAYEKVLLDAIAGNHELFVGSDEVLESWRIIAPVQEFWARESADLFFYTPHEDPRHS